MRSTLGIAVGLGLAALFVDQTAARACGCLHGPAQVQPVVQTGEHILFVVDNGMVTMHVQVAYTGTTVVSPFGWLLPMPSMPSLELGSADVFTALGQVTGPIYDVVAAQCPSAGGDGGAGGGGGGAFGGEAFGCGCDGTRAVTTPTTSTPAPTVGGGNPIASGAPNPVVSQGNLGPYQWVALDASSQQPLADWLDANHLFSPVTDPNVLAPYVGPGRYFLALLLQPTTLVGGIQPIVLHYASDLPMIPLTLTSFASAPTLPMTVWVAGASRAIPRNYLHVVLNDARLDWLGGAGNYKNLVAAAVREAATGEAFLTEYAGSGADVAKLLAAPYASLFAQPKLTRLFTMIDSVNMKDDPVFSFNPDLPDVSSTFVAALSTGCFPSGTDALVTADGLSVPYENGALVVPAMPASLRIETLRDSGPPQVVTDNTAFITAALAAAAAGQLPSVPYQTVDAASPPYDGGGPNLDAGISLAPTRPTRRGGLLWTLVFAPLALVMRRIRKR